MKGSFTLRIFVLYFMVMGLPILVDSLFFYQRSYANAISKAREDMLESVEYHAMRLKEFRPVPDHFLEDMSYFMHLQEGVSETTSQILEELKEITFVNFLLLRLPETGEENLPVIAASTPSWVGESFPLHLGLEQMLFKGKISLIGYLPAFAKEGERIFLQGFLVDSGGKATSLLLAFTSIEEKLSELLSSQKKQRVDFALMDENGVVFDSSKKKFIGNYFMTKKKKASGEHLRGAKLANKPLEMADAPEGFTDFVFNKHNYIAYQKKDPELGYSLLGFMQKKQFLLSSQRHLIFFYILYIGLNIGGAILALFLSIWISKPLNHLSLQMQRVQEGDYSAQFIPSFLGSEINRLGNLFNSTLKALLTHIKKAEDEQVERMTYQKEIEVGREIQEVLLSKKNYTFGEALVSTQYLPAQEVGGDFCCVDKQGEDFWFALGDASGKGISSSLFSLSARSLLRTYATDYEDVGEVCARSNDAFIESAKESGMFVTAVVGKYFSQKRELHYYSSGHPPGLLRKANGTLVSLEEGGMAIGLLKAKEYQEKVVTLEKGDLLLFYTKGLVGGVNEKGQHFSLERVKDLLRHRNWERPEELVSGLLEEFTQFTQGLPQVDEVVLLSIAIV